MWIFFKLSSPYLDSILSGAECCSFYLCVISISILWQIHAKSCKYYHVRNKELNLNSSPKMDNCVAK